MKDEHQVIHQCWSHKTRSVTQKRRSKCLWTKKRMSLMKEATTRLMT